MGRNEIIQQALLKIGAVSVYNDTRSEEWEIAEATLDSVIEQIAIDGTFLFNSTEAKLTKAQVGATDEGFFVFNRPNDALNILRSLNDYKIIGEFIYSASDEITIQYCRRVQFSEIPAYMHSVLIYKLAVELSENDPTAEDRIQLLELRYQQASRKVMQMEGFNFGG